MKENQTDTADDNFDSDASNSSEEGGYFVRKFRRSKNKYNTDLREPIHRKTAKVSKGKKWNESFIENTNFSSKGSENKIDASVSSLSSLSDSVSNTGDSENNGK